MTYWVNGSGLVYTGDMVPGDAAATSPEISDWFSALVTEEVVKSECNRRMALKFSAISFSNIQSYISNLLISVVINSATLTGSEEDDIALFQSLQGWIADMLAIVPTVIGNELYADDDIWGSTVAAFPVDLPDFIARF